MKNFDVIAYTDGSARPQPGYAGWGIHAILLNEPEQFSFPDQLNNKIVGQRLLNDTILITARTKKEWTLTDNDNITTVYTHKDTIDAWGPLPYPSTNNYAEASAILNVLKMAIECSWKHVMVLADSKYVLLGMMKLAKDTNPTINTLTRGKADMPNLALWKDIVKEYKRCLDAGIQLQWDWVEGHSGNAGNECADVNSNRGRLQASGEVDNKPEVFMASKNKSAKVNRIPGSFHQKHWYFMPCEDNIVDGQHMYFFGDHGKENDLIGKPRSESRISVVMAKAGVGVFDGIRDVVRKTVDKINYVHVGKGDNIVGAAFTSEFNIHGGDYVDYVNDHGIYKSIVGKELVSTMSPALKAFRLYSALCTLGETLCDIQNNRMTNIHAVDITDLLLDKNKAGKYVTKPELGAVVSAITVEHPAADKAITITLGIDLPTKNTLAKIAKDNPKISLMWVKMGEMTGRYFVHITDDMSDSLWSAYQANLTIRV